MQDLKLTARYILILLPPTIDGAFNVRLGVQTNVPEVRSTGDFAIAYCPDIATGIKRALNLIDNMKLDFADDFTLVYPLFQPANEEQEAKIINIAWEVKAAADEQEWIFSRTVPIYDY